MKESIRNVKTLMSHVWGTLKGHEIALKGEWGQFGNFEEARIQSIDNGIYTYIYPTKVLN